MFKRKELTEIPNVKPIAAETKKQRAKEGKQRSKQLRRSAKQSEMNAAQSARSIKKRRAPEKAADCLQYERMYESGICEVEPGLFSMTMAFTDVNFQLARQEEQKSLFTQYSEFLNYFDPDTHLQISLVTRRVDEAEFRRDTFLPLRGDSRDRYSEEMNRVISEKALQGQNGLIREKYITISLHEDDYRKAQVRLLKRAEDIQNLFKRMGSTVRRLSGIERLNLLHGITRPEEVMAFSYDWLLAEDSITTKDFIAPSGYNWKPEHDDSRAVYNDRYQFGEYYGKVLYLRDIAPQMKDNLLSLLSDLDFDNAISIHVDAVEQREAVEQVQKQLAYMQKEKGDGMVNAVRMNLPAYMGVRYELTNQIEDAEELLDNLHNYNQKIFKVCILIHTYGRNNAELDERVQQICNTVQQQTCRFSPIPFEQCAAMNSVLPLGKKWLALERTLLTVNTAIYVPFTTQELFQPGGLYEGTNARSKNLIMVNRKLLPAPAGMVLGMTGFGKSFAVIKDLWMALNNQRDKRSKEIALALRIFATGSMQAFAQPTNVDMSNRLICFNIQSLGEQLKPVAMLSMLEYINTAVMSNERNHPKAATWVYFDEIYLLLRDSLSANFLYTSWKRFRKYNAYATGITQNVQDCLTNDTAYAMLANSEFVVMLRQTKDIDSVVELYGLSEPQRKYLLLAQPGEGIIKMGNSLIPFNNPQPKDTKTYKLLTTKPGEMEG